MKLTSTAFQHGQRIPKVYTGEGKDISPPLKWEDAPEGTKQFAVVCIDPDAPGVEPWVHWVLYHLPPTVRELPEGLPATQQLAEPEGALQGLNSWSMGHMIGYRGPMPHAGTGMHHYQFTVYALNTELDLAGGIEKRTLLCAMDGHILEQAELVGTYDR